MKRGRDTILFIIAIGLFLVLGLDIFIEKFDERGEEKTRQDPFVFDVSIAERVTITKGTSSESVKLVRKYDGMVQKNMWLVGGVRLDDDILSDAEQYRANDDMIQKLLFVVAEKANGEIVSRKKEKQTFYGVDEAQAIRVVITAGDEGVTPLAEFFVGNAGSVVGTTYVRLYNSEEVFLVDVDLASMVNRSRDDFRDKTILEFPAEQVLEILLSSPQSKESLSLKREEGGFRLEGEKQGVEGTNQDRVTRLLQTLSHLSATGFATGRSLEEYGFSPERFRASLRLSDGKSHSLFFGKSSEGKVFVKRDDVVSGTNEVFTISETLFNSDIFLKKKDLVL